MIFGRAPVGLAFYDREGRFVRVNDRLAEINGLPAERTSAARWPRSCPELPEVGRRPCAPWPRPGAPAIEVEVAGETPAQPGVRREWLASYWPVRTRGEAEPLGVGAVVFEVTDRRAAERALRTQTDRYETLLLALSEVGEGMIVIEDERCVYANAAFEQLSGYTFPELAAMESVFELVERRPARGGRAARPAAGGARTSSTPPTSSRCAAATASSVLLELAGVPLRGRGPRRQLVVVVRDVTARAPGGGGARAAAAALGAAGRGQRAVRPVARRGAHRARASRGCACATSPTPAWSCSAAPPPLVAARGRAVARDPERDRLSPSCPPRS